MQINNSILTNQKEEQKMTTTEVSKEKISKEEAFNKSILSMISNLEKDVPKIMKDRQKPQFSRHSDTPGFDHSRITRIIKEISSGINNGLSLENHKEILSKLDFLSYYVASTYKYAQLEISESMSKVTAKLEKFFGEIPEGLIGEGFEIFQDHTRGKRIYHNGKYLFSLDSSAIFSKESSNGSVIAYLMKYKLGERFDRGVQNKYEIKVYHLETGKTDDIFEDHAYEGDRQLSVSLPEIQDSNVVFEIISDGVREVKKIKY